MSMFEMVKHIRNFMKAQLGEKAQGMVEYALIIAFVVAIAVYLTQSGGIGQAISGVFDSAKNQISSPAK